MNIFENIKQEISKDEYKKLDSQEGADNEAITCWNRRIHHQKEPLHLAQAVQGQRLSRVFSHLQQHSP